MSNEFVVEASGLRKSFGSLEVLRGADIQVRAGDVTVLMGASGSGKTTLIRCLNLLEEPDAGEVTVCGVHVACGADVRRDRARRLQVARLRRHAGMVFQ